MAMVISVIGSPSINASCSWRSLSTDVNLGATSFLKRLQLGAFASVTTYANAWLLYTSDLRKCCPPGPRYAVFRFGRPPRQETHVRVGVFTPLLSQLPSKSRCGWRKPAARGSNRTPQAVPPAGTNHRTTKKWRPQRQHRNGRRTHCRAFSRPFRTPTPLKSTDRQWGQRGDSTS